MSRVAKRGQGPWAPVCVGAPPQDKDPERPPSSLPGPQPRRLTPPTQPLAVVCALAGSASDPAPAPASRTASLLPGLAMVQVWRHSHLNKKASAAKR